MRSGSRSAGKRRRSDVAELYSAHPDQAVPYLHYGLLDNLGPKPGVNTAWDCYGARTGEPAGRSRRRGPG